MSAYKQFTTKDIVITPFFANKGFRFTGNALTASNVGVEVYFGTQPPTNKLIFETSQQTTWGQQSPSISGSQNFTGFVNKLNTNSIYSSAMQLYYSNYFGSQSGSLVATSSVIPGGPGPRNNPFAEYNNINIGIEGSNNTPIGAVKSPQYDNYLSSTITQIRTALMGETVTVSGVSNNNFLSTISIPSKLWGQNIEPQSFSILYNYNGGVQTYTVWDDGGGNLRYNYVNTSTPSQNVENEYCGNITYEHGLAVLTPISESNSNPYSGKQGLLANLGSGILTGQNGFTAGTNELQYLTVGWSSSVTLYEHQYKCTIRENEFGYSLNPSLLTGSISTDNNTTYKDFATGSYFSPYITTVGLYDNDQNLLAIGKLSVPTKVPMNADLEIQVAFDSL
jgi:hypothetical protein|tara:strand:- start:55 stop:1233 length:1179 start_codon:yes stop_codon:yes gene_type:complete